MPSNPFGQADSGSFFASLYSATRSNQKAVQSAADQDAYDNWQNGLMDDQTWLAYIATRISATASDPTEHEKWVTAQRKYVSQISDNQAEFAYKNGGSIGSLITYYTGKMGGLNSGSQEFRNVQLRLNDLMDTRAANDITDGSQRLMNQIDAGTSTYADLLRFYRDHLSSLRPNSDLYQQVQGQIEKVNDTVKTNALNGEFEQLQYLYQTKKLTGAAYAAKLRTMAVQFQANDPQKYYQLLESAAKLDAAPGLAGTGSGGSSRKSTTNALDAIQAQRFQLYQLIDQFDGGNQAGVLNGQTVQFTPETVKAIDNQILSTHSAAAAIYAAKGDYSAAAHENLLASQYITGTGSSPGHMQVHNTMAIDQLRTELFLHSQQALALSSQNPDPQALTTTAQTLSRGWANFAKSLTTTPTGEFIPQGEGQYAQGTTASAQKDMATPQFVAQTQAIADAMAVVTNWSPIAGTGSDDAAVQAAIETLNANFAKDPVTGQPNALGKQIMDLLINPALLGPATQQGLATGAVIQVATPGGFEAHATVPATVHILDAAGNDSIQTVNVPIGSDGKQMTGLVNVYVDVNGTPTAMKATVQQQASSLTGLVALAAIPATQGVAAIKKGDYIDYRTIETWKANGTLDRQLAAGTVQAQAIPVDTIVIPASTASDGTWRPATTFSRDPQTHQWYEGGLPIRGAQRVDGTPYVKWDATAQVWLMDYKPYASADGQTVPYAGKNDQAMQAIFDANPGAFYVDENGNTIGIRDALGKVSYDPLAVREQTQRQYYDATMADERPGFRADQLLYRDQLAARTAANSVTGDTRSELNGVGADVMKGITDLGKSIGIAFATREADSNLFAIKTPSSGATNFDTRSEALGTAAPAIAQFDPTAQPSFSGPAITGTTAPTITSVLPATAPLITLPRPVPTYNAPTLAGDTRSESLGIASAQPAAQLRNPQVYPSSWTDRGGM